MAQKITLYSIPNCAFCDRAKALLKDKNLAYEEVKMDRNDSQAVQDLFAKSGMRTFPQIFFLTVRRSGATPSWLRKWVEKRKTRSRLAPPRV